MVFDALKSVEELQDAGVPEIQAKAQIRILQGVIESDLATKRDLAELRKATGHDLAEFRKATKHDLAEFQKATKHDLAEFREATKHDLAELELRLMAKLTELDKEIKTQELRLFVKLGSLLVVGLMVMVAFSKLGIL